MIRARLLPALLLAALGLAGCTETDETLAFESDGGGTWTFTARWDAGLLARVTGIVGGDVMRRLEGRPFPLREDQIRASLEGVEGVSIEEIVEASGDGGFREVRVRLRFRRFADLVAWEVFARRTVSVTRREDGSLVFAMDPSRDIPVFGTLAALARALEEGAGPGGDPAEAQKDPGPLERLGVRPEDAALLESLLRPRLDKVRFRFRVQVPGEVLPEGAAVAGRDPHVGGADLSFADLALADPALADPALADPALADPALAERGESAAAGRKSPVRVVWRPLTLDVPPLVEHAGDLPAPFPPP